MALSKLRRLDTGHWGRSRPERQLGKLVQFEKRSGDARPIEGERRGKAEILIFTGVRYERDSSGVPNKPLPSPGAKRKRG
jgi:hypothetical protein